MEEKQCFLQREAYTPKRKIITAAIICCLFVCFPLFLSHASWNCASAELCWYHIQWVGRGISFQYVLNYGDIFVIRACTSLICLMMSKLDGKLPLWWKNVQSFWVNSPSMAMNLSIKLGKNIEHSTSYESITFIFFFNILNLCFKILWIWDIKIFEFLSLTFEGDT